MIIEDESLLVRFTQSTDQRRFVTLRFAPNGEISIDFGQTNLQGSGFSRWFLRFVASEEEYIWGGGEQYSYFNLRQGEYYPIWIREQGVGRNKSSYLTQVRTFRNDFRH